MKILPRGVPALLTAALASIPILFMDELEVAFEPAFGEGAPAFLALVSFFVLLWLTGATAILATTSREPRRDGLRAGALIFTLMIAILISISRTYGDVIVIVFLLGAMFGSLALGMGALSGLVAERLQSRPRPSQGPGGKAPWIAILAGFVVFATATLFVPRGGGILFPLAIAIILLGVGIYGLAMNPGATKEGS
jgi:hypothetical protein